MKVTPTLFALLGSCAVFILSPYIPYSVLRLAVGNHLSAAALMGLVLFALAHDRVLGLASFLAVAALFLEQRRRTVEKVTKVADPAIKPSFSVEQLSKPAPNIVPGEVHPPRKDAEVDDYSFEPSEESGTNKFEAVDESYDHKEPSDTVPPHPSEVSDFLQLKGLASLP
jgi:hypothetical protein